MTIREKILEILEKHIETDWGFDGEDEAPYETFDAKAAADELEELWKLNICKG
jgi:hypothetical protein